MSKRAVITASSGTGILGYILGRLTTADLRHFLDRIFDGAGQFIHEQGPYVAYSLLMAFLLGGGSVAAIKQLIKGKNEEIERLVEERDRFQKPFLENWKSSKKGKS